MSTATPSTFYITGGTLRQDAPSYIERQADRDLYEGLTRGEFCYVLTSRQMGKSSLMVHTAARLREAGASVAVLDLTAIGQNLSAEQWYGGLLRRLGLQLDASGKLEEELDDFWFDQQERIGALERWMRALQQLVLPRCPGRLILFIDEIDAVRSLSFSTDEFFAAIRECYNRRSQDPAFERLTFCLLGVATPSDLIQDTRTTPFNIGTRIDLTDFTAGEAAPLAAGLVPAFYHEGHEGHEEREADGEGKTTGDPALATALLGRVLYWTSGHPYLTQRLCQAIAQSPNPKSRIQNPKWEVDRHCDELFLSAQAREKDDNLLFVRERLLKSEADRASLLDLYAQVWRGRQVGVDDTNPLIDLLRLSGVARLAGGRLVVRNRIYARVFDRNWITQHMPDAELRRQRAAYRRGLLRATAVAAIIVAVVVSLALAAVTQARRAEQQRRLALAGQRALRGSLYATQMNLVQQAWKEGDLSRAKELLNAQRPGPGREDVRGFDWRFLWRLCQGDERATLRGHRVQAGPLAFSPDGKTLASGDAQGTVRLWDLGSQRPTAILAGRKGVIFSLAYSPDGKTLISAMVGDGSIRLRDVAARREIARLNNPRDPFVLARLSPDGKTLAAGTAAGSLQLWNVAAHRRVAALNGHARRVSAVAFSPDGKTLASGSDDGAIRLWNLITKRTEAVLTGHTGPVTAVAFSPDGHLLASGSPDDTAKLWDVATRREVATLAGHTDWVTAVAFSPDGTTLATGSDDSTIKLWSVAHKLEIATLKGHSAQVFSIAFSPDGRTLASGGNDKTVRLWDAHPRPKVPALSGPLEWVATVACSPDGKLLASGSLDGTIRLWEIASQREVARLPGVRGPAVAVAFSPGVKLVTAAIDGAKTLRLREVASRWRIAGLPGPAPAAWSRLVSGRGMAFSPDGTTLAAAGEDGAVRLWSMPLRRVTATLAQQPYLLGPVAFSPDGKRLATGIMGQHAVKLWDVTSGKGGRVFPHTGEVWCVGFSPDGRVLAAGSEDRTVKLWDIRSGQELATLKGHKLQVSCLAFAPDRKILATGSSDNSIKLWSLASYQEVTTLREHKDGVLSLAFSSDGNLLVSGSKDGTVRLWRAASFEEADRPAPPALAPVPVISSCGGDRTVTLQWRPVLQATGYRVYRGPEDAALAQLVRLTTQPVTGTRYVDHSPGLVNGRPQTYGVTAIAREPGGKTTESPMETLQAAPVAPPPGFLASSIDEGALPGSAVLHPASGELLLRGSGADVWGDTDGFYFLSRPVTGDFRITVRAMTRPAETDEWAKAGPMVREALEPGGRNYYLMATSYRGLIAQCRTTRDGLTDSIGVIHKPPPERTTLKLPLLLRLIRRGNTITAQYSQDGGRSFHAAGAPVTFEPPLAKTVQAGLAITSRDEGQTTEAKFSGLKIEPLSR